MCDLVGQAIAQGVSRRALLRATGSAALASVATTAPGTAAPAPPLAATAKARRHRTRVVLLGTTGGPVWVVPSRAPIRHGIASALVVDRAVYLVDCGEGVGLQYRRAGLGPTNLQHGLERLRAIFLTHLHSDHTIDYPNIPIFGIFNGLPGARAPVEVYGPGDRGVLPAGVRRTPAASRRPTGAADAWHRGDDRTALRA
jgi:glyoxylase-like metal-dependent hydrolase (beta-lactamase superfamily II)